MRLQIRIEIAGCLDRPARKKATSGLAAGRRQWPNGCMTTFHDPKPSSSFCATGLSGGAAQVSYMLSHYGLK